ncbi:MULTISPECIES: hypothetical protein [unclassified Mesorhizobium]|uniref:hypothetical protein n=1 Tax=unclassified Mesorhizobium TaxID=325217 RepID=UPI001674F28C|nr:MULTISPECIES: hypothetical protein [unclassified Mesorhizobium]
MLRAIWKIAKILNAEGVRSARGKLFSYENIWLLRHRWGIPTAKINIRRAGLMEPTLYRAQPLAWRLKPSSTTSPRALSTVGKARKASLGRSAFPATRSFNFNADCNGPGDQGKVHHEAFRGSRGGNRDP